MLIAFACLMVIAAIGVTECRVTRCPRHSDCFDALVCPLCSIYMLRGQEIAEHVAKFEQGRNGGLFADTRSLKQRMLDNQNDIIWRYG